VLFIIIFGTLSFPICSTPATCPRDIWRYITLHVWYCIVYRLELRWSVVEFAESQYVVCEDVGTLAVRLLRRGSLNHSSTVAVRLRAMSAKQHADFTPTSPALVRFPPGELQLSTLYRQLGVRRLTA